MVKHRQDMARVVRVPSRAREQPTLLHIDTREELINALHEARIGNPNALCRPAPLAARRSTALAGAGQAPQDGGG